MNSSKQDNLDDLLELNTRKLEYSKSVYNSFKELPKFNTNNNSLNNSQNILDSVFDKINRETPKLYNSESQKVMKNKNYLMKSILSVY